MMNKLTQFVFVILIGVASVLFPCDGKITIVNSTKYAVPGDNVTIEWKITNPISDLISRIWTFDTTEEPIANINDKGELTIRNSSLPEVKVKPPSTLILENVDNKYNGTYSFLIVATTKGDTSDTSYVEVIVAALANVTINCSNPTLVDEDKDVRCLCKGEGGNPLAKVIWHDKDGGKIGVPRDKEKMLTLSNVDGTYNGTYKCVAQSYTLTAEKSIEVKVRPNFPPVVTRFTSKPEKAALDEPVTITCEADARPPPSYTIIHNDTVTVSFEKTYTIKVVNYSHAGSYKCIAKNKLGNNSKTYNLSVVATDPPTTPRSTTPIKTTKKGTTTTTKPGTVKTPQDTSGDDFPVPAIIGIVIGVLVLIVGVIILVFWYKKRGKDRRRGNVIVSSGSNDPSRGNNLYESVNDDAKASNDNAEESTSASPPGSAKPPAVYATVDKNRKNEPPTLTYATLDAVAMKPNGSKKRENEPTREQTEYASIQFKDLKADLV